LSSFNLFKINCGFHQCSRNGGARGKGSPVKRSRESNLKLFMRFIKTRQILLNLQLQLKNHFLTINTKRKKNSEYSRISPKEVAYSIMHYHQSQTSIIHDKTTEKFKKTKNKQTLVKKYPRKKRVCLHLQGE